MKCLWQEVSTLRQRQQNSILTARSDKSVAYLKIKDSARRFVQLKLTSDRHEASRGLSAIAELLVTTVARLNLIDRLLERDLWRCSAERLQKSGGSRHASIPVPLSLPPLPLFPLPHPPIPKPPVNQLGAMGSAISSTSGSGGGARPKNTLSVYLRLKWRIW